MFSFVIPFHSDFSRLSKTLEILTKNEEKYKITEMLLCHNGPKMDPKDWQELSSKLPKNAKLLHTDKKGIGAGYKLGIENSTQAYTILSASDLPFGFTDIESFQQHTPPPLFAIGSKAHKDSKIQGYGLKRTIMSYGFWLVRALFLGSKTPKDSQGSILIDTQLAKGLIKKSLYDNYFFSVELITLAQQQKVNTVEIPVILENHIGESSVSAIRDSWSLAKNLISFAKRIRLEK